MTAFFERIELPGHARPRAIGEVSAGGFPRWLSQWRERQADGWIVDVWVDYDRTHAVARACRPSEAM